MCCAVACVSTWVNWLVHWLFVRVAPHPPIMCGARCCASCVVRVGVMLLRPCSAVCGDAYSGPVWFVCPRTLRMRAYTETFAEAPEQTLLASGMLYCMCPCTLSTCYHTRACAHATTRRHLRHALCLSLLLPLLLPLQRDILPLGPDRATAEQSRKLMLQ